MAFTLVKPKGAKKQTKTNMSNEIITALATAIGALVGGFASWLAIYQQTKNNLIDNKTQLLTKKKEELFITLDLLNGEMCAAYNKAGEALEKKISYEVFYEKNELNHINKINMLVSLYIYFLNDFREDLNDSYNSFIEFYNELHFKIKSKEATPKDIETLLSLLKGCRKKIDEFQRVVVNHDITNYLK